MTTSTSAPTEALQLRGVVHRAFFSSPSFSAGLLRNDDGDFVKFRGRFCATEGDAVTLVGRWVKDAKFGRQFDVEQLSYDLPESPAGLVQYLASHPAFTGIGLKTAEKIVDYAGDGESLDRLIREDIDGLHRHLRIPMATLTALREAWIANDDQNEIRSFLAQFGLTNRQVETLLATYGNAVVGVLRNDPYALIKHVDGYGFKRVDQIARKMGVPKDRPSRIEAAIIYCLGEEISSGHTWTAGCDLLEKANEALVLDGLNGRDLIRASADALLERGEIVADGAAVTKPSMLEAERLIRDCLGDHAWEQRDLVPEGAHLQQLNPGQLGAYRTSLTSGISVISGGAGTGKTYVISRLVRSFHEHGFEVALCAPTGKAAKRIEEVMRQNGLEVKALTIHRLLAYDGRVFKRQSLSTPYKGFNDSGTEVQLAPAYQVVIVDEASMVDVPLMAEVLGRIDFTRTQVVLVGDHNQLPPVGPGNVLRDILRGNLVPKTILTEVVRQAGVLKANSTQVLSGVIAPTAVNDPGWAVIDCFREPLQIQTYLRDLVLHMIPERLGYDPVRDVQIITPTHKGPLGTKALNEMMQFLLHGKVEGRFALGEKVIQMANDYQMGIMNGTIGHVVDIEKGNYFVEFGGGLVRKIDHDRQQHVQLAYALTAHKAQGSEFPCAVVVCHKSHFFADRNWLYTAVTRAAKTCILVGDRWGLHHAAGKNNTIKRRTFLNLWAERVGADGSGAKGISNPIGERA
jgi:exodeoxyribonuclease V alpha subunit